MKTKQTEAWFIKTQKTTAINYEDSSSKSSDSSSSQEISSEKSDEDKKEENKEEDYVDYNLPIMTPKTENAIMETSFDLDDQKKQIQFEQEVFEDPVFLPNGDSEDEDNYRFRLDTETYLENRS